MQLLIDLGADVDRQTGDKEDTTALMYAVFFNWRMVVRVLLEAGADPNIRELCLLIRLIYFMMMMIYGDG